MYHVQTYEYLATERKSQVRKYLTATGDFPRLRAFDEDNLRESDHG